MDASSAAAILVVIAVRCYWSPVGDALARYYDILMAILILVFSLFLFCLSLSLSLFYVDRTCGEWKNILIARARGERGEGGGNRAFKG